MRFEDFFGNLEHWEEVLVLSLLTCGEVGHTGAAVTGIVTSFGQSRLSVAGWCSDQGDDIVEIDTPGDGPEIEEIRILGRDQGREGGELHLLLFLSGTFTEDGRSSGKEDVFRRTRRRSVLRCGGLEDELIHLRREERGDFVVIVSGVDVAEEVQHFQDRFLNVKNGPLWAFSDAPGLAEFGFVTRF